MVEVDKLKRSETLGGVPTEYLGNSAESVALHEILVKEDQVNGFSVTVARFADGTEAEVINFQDGTFGLKTVEGGKTRFRTFDEDEIGQMYRAVRG